jgi:nucleoside-diphosphate-sugar epimerase
VKTALVTGSSGFVGRHFVKELDRRGYRVVRCDIADQNQRDVMELARSNQMTYDLVVHAAARNPHRKAIDTQPAAMVYNQMLDAVMFEWAIRSEPRHMIYLSSSAVYPVGLQTPRAFNYRMSEKDADTSLITTNLLKVLGSMADLQPDGIYGKIKRTGEGLALQLQDAGVQVHVVRPFSGYGEDQTPDYPFGRFAEQINNREPIIRIWGDGHQVRDWIHVDDVVNGALAMMDGDISAPHNLCTGVGTNMINLVAKMAKDAGYVPRLEFVKGPTGVAVRVGDPGRMEQLYTPKISLDEGVFRAIRAR